MTNESDSLSLPDPRTQGFHINPHLVVTESPDGGFDVTAPWTDCTGWGETEREAVGMFTQLWKRRMLASEAERAAVIAFLAEQDYGPAQRGGSRPG